MQNKKVYGYTLLRLLGQGGMAEVWYAENKIHKPAAVKFLLPKFCSDSDVVNRFRAEAEVMVKLNHPNIRQVYDYDEVDGCPCIVMEYLEGADLAARMKGGEHFTDEQLQKWWNQLAAALNYTHGEGVVHRDIKPSNIFITDKGDVKLLDFGIAKVRDSIVSTHTGATMGTLMYMSPEQVRDSKHIDHKTDLYSLAVTFVHLLTGCAPYDRDTTDDFEIRVSIVQKPLDLSGLSSGWQTLLQPYLAKNPADRPALKEFDGDSAEHGGFVPPVVLEAPVPEETVVSGASAAATRVLVDEETVADVPPMDSNENTVAESSSAQPQPQPQPKPKSQPRSRKVWPWVLAVVLAVVVLLVLLVRGCADGAKTENKEERKPAANDTVALQGDAAGTADTTALMADAEVEKIEEIASNEGNSGENQGRIQPKETPAVPSASTEKPTKPVPEGYVDLGLSVYWKNSNEWNSSDDHGFYTYTEAKSEFGSRLPTKKQWDELLNKKNCTWRWTGSGYKVTGTNGQSIYLPAAGFREAGWKEATEGSCSYYWSSTPYDWPEYAYALCFYSGFRSCSSGNSPYGQGYSVRLVRSK